MRTTMFKAKVIASAADAKAVDAGLAEGQFKALVSVFGNVDTYGDVMMPGAFTDTLAEWAASGNLLPVVWAHDWGNPFAHIGWVVKAEETDQGLVVTGQIDAEDNPTAAQVWRLLKARRITQFSFAFDVLDGAFAERDGVDVFEIRSVRLHEVGPCLVGVNQETDLIAAKAHALTRAKAGRVLSQKNYEALQNAYDAIGAVLDSATPEKSRPATGDAGTPQTSDAPASDTPQETSQAATPPAAEEPDGAKATPAAPRAPRRALWAATISTL